MVRVGVIGCGNIAQVHGWVLSEMKNIELVAACDVLKERAEAFMRTYCSCVKQEGTFDCKQEKSFDGRQDESAGCKGIYTDWKELLELDLDVVHICTPHYLHAPMAVEFLRHGKAVFMEKPCAVNRTQFEELRREDALHSGQLGFCFQNRYNVSTKKLDELVGEGRIGAVTGARAFVTWRRDSDYYRSPWKGKWETEGGGVLINQSIHTLDLMLRYLGKPVQVAASAHNHHLMGATEVEDTVEAWIMSDLGQRACFYASNGYAADAPVILELQGTNGRIAMNGSEITLWPGESAPEHFFCQEKQGIGKGYWGAGHRECIQDFYGALEKKQPFAVGLNSVEKTFDVMMRIYEAAGVPKAWA